MKSSRIKGFYKLGRGERLDQISAFANLPVDQTRLIGQDGSLSFEAADLFIENAVGSFPLPFGMATSFHINGTDYIIPMAVEESSVIAAASNAAKWIYESGGFTSTTVSSQMIGQIQILDVAPERMEEVAALLLASEAHLVQLANEIHPRLVMRGGGAKGIEVRTFPEAEIPFMVLHLLLDTKDAMGANLVNTACEKLAPEIEKISQGRVGLRILSNFADRKVFRCQARVNPALLELKDDSSNSSTRTLSQKIIEAFVFADSDPYRAATHNKGIMNGIDPVVIATGNDWRAVEAGAHAFASRSGRYRSLSRWSIAPDGFLVGELEIPLQLGTVGGVTRLHPLSKVSLQILGNPNAETLGQIICCVGLASNLAALRALCSTGIQRGHMKLHAKNLALAAGAKGDEVEIVSRRLTQTQKVSASMAEQIVNELRAVRATENLEVDNAVAPSVPV